MLLQTNSYIVPAEHRAEHSELLARFRQALLRLGCDSFEIYEQAGPNWSEAEKTGRFIQIMRFRDREHQLAVQAAEREDTEAQSLIAEFCELINFPYQQQHGFFAVGFYVDEQTAAGEKQPAGPRLATDDAGAAEDLAGEGPAAADANDEYAEQELDALIAEFGAPDMRDTLNELERESAASAQHSVAGLPATSAEANQTPSHGGSGIGDVLDAGLIDDEDDLDVAMPAELIEDEADEVESHVSDGGHPLDDGKTSRPRR
jgi:hypothetical protein